MLAKAVFLDRDGVINRKAPAGEYITSWSGIDFLPGALEAVAILCKFGFKVIVVTNQRGIATGKIKLADLEEIHLRMKVAVSEIGAALSASYYCPHDRSDDCACRKPSPGMLVQAAQTHSLDLSNCWMVGDSPSDIGAGKRAGCRTALITSDRVVREVEGDVDIAEESLLLAVTKILQLEERRQVKCDLQESLPLNRLSEVS